jgi:geranylgeranyl diphosphate synthase type II
VLSGADRDAYLQGCRLEALRHIETLIPSGNREHPAYRSVLDYPLREAKGLRPAIAIATCRALGGGLAEVIPTAAVFELLHNAFLVHDDVEDGSEMRRHAPTLAAQLGMPLAVHTGDTMLAMALDPLLENMKLLDLGRALRVLDLIATVMRRTVEGQALELTWIAERRWDVSPAEYLEMVALKTAWYTFAGPLAAGALVAEAPQALVDELLAFGLDVGVAFQIHDDVLNLVGATSKIGKESAGDLWEGKRTLILALFFETASETDAAEARAVLAKPRPDPAVDARDAEHVSRVLAILDARAGRDRRELTDAFRAARAERVKTADEVRRVRELIEPAIAPAAATAAQIARRASERWSHIREAMAPSIHRDLIESVLDYIVVRGY